VLFNSGGHPLGLGSAVHGGVVRTHDRMGWSGGYGRQAVSSCRSCLAAFNRHWKTMSAAVTAA